MERESLKLSGVFILFKNSYTESLKNKVFNINK